MNDDGIIEERFARYFANWDIHLPERAMQLKEAGEVFKAGWAIRYTFDQNDDGLYLEFYATHRMTDDRRVRI